MLKSYPAGVKVIKNGPGKRVRRETVSGVKSREQDTGLMWSVHP